MSGKSRIVIVGFPHHIIQRGHNRQVICASDDDYLYCLDNLRQWKARLSSLVYAYCLMTNHVHLIIDPGHKEGNLAQLMKHVSGRQTRYVKKLERRTGCLWEGRYKSTPISTDEYLLACCRYVELNPVRAGIVDDPAQIIVGPVMASKLANIRKNGWITIPATLALPEVSKKGRKDMRSG